MWGRGLEGTLAALKDLEARPPFSLLDLVPLNPLRSNPSNKLSRLAAGVRMRPFFSGRLRKSRKPRALTRRFSDQSTSCYGLRSARFG